MICLQLFDRSLADILKEKKKGKESEGEGTEHCSSGDAGCQLQQRSRPIEASSYRTLAVDA